MKTLVRTALLISILALMLVAGSQICSAQSWVVSPGTALPNDATAAKYFPYQCITNANVTYGSHNSHEIGDLYLPNPMPTNRMPAVILVHGGGGTGGSRLSTRETQQGQLLAAHGYVAFNIDYTVGAVWPKNIQDWRLAVRWLRANAATYNIDTNHIGIIGGSFGGYAAGIMAGITNGQKTLVPDSNASYNNISLDVYSGDALNAYSGDVQAGFDMYGPMLFTGTAPFADASGQYSSPTADTYFNASAVHYVHATSVPLFITQGTADTTVDITNSYIMTNALKLANVPYQFARISGAAHTFCIFDSTKGGTWPAGGTSGLIDLRKDMCDFFDQWLLVSGQAPSIASQPQFTTGCVGSPVNFSVTANGSAPLGFQWRFNGTNILNATNTAYAFTITSTNNAGNYSVVVSNSLGTITSSNAVLTVNTATLPSISAHPTNTTVLAGNAATFSVTATGDALQYLWSGPTGLIAGATNATLTIINAQNSNAGNYSVTVFNACNAVVSSNAVLTVNGAPGITAQPGAQTACTGTTASFLVSAIGSGPLAYQWYDFANNPIASGNGSVVTLTNLYPTNSGNYFVVVTNAYGAVTSSVASLTVSTNSTLSIATQPTNTEVLVGGTASFTVVPAGGGNYTYLWHAGDAEPIPHAVSITNATLTITNAQPSDIAPYTCLVMNDCSQISAEPANLVVDYAPVVLQSPTNQSAFAGSAGTFNVVANGTMPLNYQWRKGGTNLLGQTNIFYTTGILTTNDGGNFDVIISNPYGSVTSALATLTVLPSAAGQVLIAELYASGGKTGSAYNRDYVVLKNVTASPVMMNGWSIQHLKTNALWVSLPLPTVTIPVGGYYLIQFYNDGTAGSSTNGLALPTPDFTVTQNSLWNLSSGTGEAVALVSSTNLLASCTDGTIVDKVGFNTGAVYYLGSGPTSASTVTQSVVRGNAGCLNSDNNTADFALGTPTPRNSLSVVSPCVCAGAGVLTNPVSVLVTNGYAAAFSVVASGSQPFAYQWRKAGVVISGATNDTYSFTTSSTNDNGSFDVVITNGCGAVTSSVASLTVTNIAPSITAQPQGQTVIAGANVSFSVTATGSLPLSYQWRKGGTNISGATSASYSINSTVVGDSGNFSVVVSNAFGTAISSNASLTVNAPAGVTASLVFQGFEGTTNDTWSFTNNTTTFGTGGSAGTSTNTGPADTLPAANQRIRSGTHSFQVNNLASLASPSVVTLLPVNTAGYNDLVATVHLAATSPGNGLDATDYIKLYVATNNGAFPTSPDIFLKGNANADWSYSAVLSTNATAGVPVTVSAPQGGSSTSNYSTLTVTIPGLGATNVSLKIEIANDGTSEWWNVDDVSLAGVVAGSLQTISAASVTNVTANSSLFKATVTPGSSPVNVYFQYGATTNYGSFTSTNSLLAGTNAIALSNSIVGLTPRTTYHFRAVASSSFGPVVGGDTSFTTLGIVGTKGVFYTSGGFFPGTYNFSFQGDPGQSFSVWSTTNICLPLAQWTQETDLATGEMTMYETTYPGQPSAYSFTVQPPTDGQVYYRVRNP